MAYSTNQLRETIRRYLDILKREIHLDQVILFGSYVWGHPKPYSDIDLAIISRDFRDKNEIKDMQFLFKRASQVDTAIEPHPYHPKDLQNLDKRTLLYRIVKKGRKISFS